jgi:hypothetical protein
MGMMLWLYGEMFKMLNSEQNPEVCDTTDDDSSTNAGNIIVLVSVNQCPFVAKQKNPGYKTGIHELSG